MIVRVDGVAAVEREAAHAPAGNRFLLDDRHVVAEQGQVVGGCGSGRAGADDDDAAAVERLREALAQAREFAEAAEQPGGIGIRRVDDGVLAGAGLYGAIERATGSPKAASEYLQSIGIPGLRYLDGNSRASGEGSANYVIWDEALLTPEAARIEAVYNQGPRAAFNPERLAITLLGGADLSSFLHESGHFFFEKNRPATFKYPLWSLMGDWRMFFETVSGRRKF